MNSIRHAVILLSTLGALATHELCAAPVTISYTFTKQDTGDILPGEWTFDSSEQLFFWTQSLYNGGVVMSLEIINESLDPTSGTGELTYVLDIGGGDGSDWVFDADVRYELPHSLDNIMVGGEYSTYSLSPMIEFNGQPLASIITDQNPVSGSAVQYTDGVETPGYFFAANFGNGEPSLPTQFINSSIGTRHTIKLATSFFLQQYVTLKTSSTTQCPDFNGDKIVDSADLGILLGAYGPSSTALDLTNDRQINGADLAIVLGSFGSCR